MKKFAAESEEGFIEYKLKLSIVEREKIEKLATQMKYRLTEGGGEAFYIIGVTDDGFPVGISEEEIEKSLKILRLAAEKINASVKVIRKNPAKNGYIVELFIRLTRLTSPPLFITIPVLGNVDSGKSTLISVLCTGKLDDGRRGAMVKIARYLHEVVSGRTSSISSHHLGFDRDGKVINYKIADPLNEAEIFLKSNKIITFIDLAGHERYLKTTIRGVTSRTPDYILLVVAANMGLLKMGKEHLGISIALKIPV
ncbi:MAG TPA: GTP-binding protein, partial [Thermoprotei archaeon]|nr:GTP-binding protein [Thermoprotei archaeon]